MSYKDLLVVLDESRHCRTRLATATALARRFGARLAGFYAMPRLELSPFLADQFPPEALAEAHARVAQRRDDAEALFREVTDTGGITAQWREAQGDATDLATWHGRHADLAILGQADPDEDVGPDIAVERFLLGTGRPTLMLPYNFAGEAPGRSVIVAWNGTSQAARAVHDALPLLAGAEKVVLLTVDHPSAPIGDSGGATLAEHLAQHGIAAQPRLVVTDGIAPADALLSYAADEAADLIVMGVYGHSRLRELALGGVSRQILAHMTVPVLLAH
jgi:nucleotide-binding universal stress UspA family protein